MRSVLLLGLLSLALCRSAEGESLAVDGLVTAISGAALSHVEIWVEGTDKRAKSGSDGRYRLEVEPAEAERVLLAVHSGFEPHRVVLPSRAGQLTVDIILAPSPIRDFITVQARVSEEEPTLQRLEWLELVSTAGTRADPLHAVQLLPGVVSVDEGAGLFVRGGDAGETAVYYDRALLDHPFQFETPTGGYSSSVGAFALSGVSLSAGGFPARYGNALSAVLELEGRERPERSSTQINLGLAGASAGIERSFGESWSLRAAANRTDINPLVELNDPDVEFLEAPHGWDTSLSLFRTGGDGSGLRIDALVRRSALESSLENRNFVGLLDSATSHRLLATTWQREVGGTGELSVTTAWSDFEDTVAIGRLDIASRERSLRSRVDFERSVGRWRGRLGFEAELERHRSVGLLPEVGGDFEGDQGLQIWDNSAERRRTGAYGELWRPIGLWQLRFGLRADRSTEPDDTTLEPRLDLVRTLGTRHRLHAAIGLYRQTPEFEYLSEAVGNPLLELPTARHLVVGYAFGEERGPLHLRLELYDKVYDDLPIESETVGFTSTGDGFARGLDLLLRIDRRPAWSGWLAYSQLDAERLYTPWHERGLYPIATESFAPTFAVDHTLQAVFDKDLPAAVSLSVGLRLATGAPFTPVLSGELQDEIWIPVHGPINSERLPARARLDLSLSRPIAVRGGWITLLHGGVTNLLDRPQVTRYVYSEDFGTRREARTGFGRAFFVGVSLVQ